MNTKIGEHTFRELDGDFPLPISSSALEDWYIEVRDTPITGLTLGDLARACRQAIFPEAVVPVCLDRLEVDPLAGDLYDGDLVRALKGLPKDYWRTHRVEMERFLSLAERAFQAGDDLELLITEDVLLQ
jgi:hypothetical protein